MMSAQLRMLLTSYLLSVFEVPPWILFGKKSSFLSRAYLAHLATGGRCYDVEDLILAEMLLTHWCESERAAQ